MSELIDKCIRVIKKPVPVARKVRRWVRRNPQETTVASALTASAITLVILVTGINNGPPPPTIVYRESTGGDVWMPTPPKKGEELTEIVRVRGQDMVLPAVPKQCWRFIGKNS